MELYFIFIHGVPGVVVDVRMLFIVKETNGLI